ncbi:Phospholipase D beta 1 [Camellia lanceoleosa]|uniref:Phospholipase D beta 1 n=1 Tax=Camellia lanceoleosa TaxID=1840588 RepID=A0ACC0GZK1_9ERIC|nr:Phospholipase D beta 1 [Camellia lanceoleosa]
MWPEGNPTGAATQRILFWQNKTMQMVYETIYEALVENRGKAIRHRISSSNQFIIRDKVHCSVMVILA